MTVSLSVALLSFYPAWMGRTSWWLPGLAITFFLIFLLEPLLLTWELRKSGDQLQITDEGVLRRLTHGQTEYVRWNDLREVSLVTTQDATGAEDYFYVLAGSGKSGVLVSQALGAGFYWLAVIGQIATGAAIRGTVSYDPMVPYFTGAAMFAGSTAPGGISSTGTSYTGSPGANPVIADNDNCPIIGLRFA
jgi:hypothetical protein